MQPDQPAPSSVSPPSPVNQGVASTATLDECLELLRVLGSSARSTVRLVGLEMRLFQIGMRWLLLLLPVILLLGLSLWGTLLFGSFHMLEMWVGSASTALLGVLALQLLALVVGVWLVQHFLRHALFPRTRAVLGGLRSAGNSSSAAPNS